MLCEFAATVYGNVATEVWQTRLACKDELKLAAQWKVLEPVWTTELPDGLSPVLFQATF